MKATAKLVSISQASDLINSGKYLNIAGDEAALTQLPKGNWIGGTIPYFMADEGGTVSRDRVFVNEIEVFGDAPTIRFYDVESLPQLCRNAPENGYTLLVVPAFGPCHSAFAENAPNYEEMYMKPLIGWVAALVWSLSKPTVVLQASQPLPTAAEGEAGTPPRQERECPYCAEPILVRAKVCKHCGKDVEPLVSE